MKVDVENILVNILFFLVLFVGCKKKDEVPEQTTLSDKYTLEIDSTFRIYQVSFSSSDSRRNFIIAYNYSPKTIRETVTYSGEPGVRVSTFHINNSGLTDSCQFSYYYYVIGFYRDKTTSRHLPGLAKKLANPDTDGT